MKHVLVTEHQRFEALAKQFDALADENLARSKNEEKSLARKQLNDFAGQWREAARIVREHAHAEEIAIKHDDGTLEVAFASRTTLINLGRGFKNFTLTDLATLMRRSQGFRIGTAVYRIVKKETM